MAELQPSYSKIIGNSMANSAPNQRYTLEQIKAFVQASPENAISFAINRNPSEMYKYIKLNYGSQFPNIKNGMQYSINTLNSMYEFLVNRYMDLQENQRVHFLKTIIDSLPVKAETNNWTTPIN